MTGPKRPARSALALTDLPKWCRLLRPAFDRGEALPVSHKDLFSRPAAFLFIEVNPFGSRDCNQSVVKNFVQRVSSWLGVRDCCEERLEQGAQKPRQPA